MSCVTCGTNENAATSYVPKIPRIARLKQQYLEYKPSLCLDLAVINTQVRKETEGEPMCIRRAKVFKKYCEEKEINIYPDELIVGNAGAHPRDAVVNAEVSVNFLNEEIDTMSERGTDPIQVTEEQKKLWKEEIAPYWEGKSTLDYWLGSLPKEWHAIGFRSGVIDLDLKVQTGPGEFSPGYEHVLFPKGYGGLKKEAEEKLKDLDYTRYEDISKIEFYKGVILTCEGMEILGNRYAEKAEEMAAEETDEQRKAELLKIAEVCRWVGVNPPRTYWEALQLLWLTTFGLYIEMGGPTFAPGRFDQWMYPFYKKAIEEEGMTREQILELTEACWIKFSESIWYLPENAAKYYSGFPVFTTVEVGGITPDGKDAVNELSYLVLDATNDVRLHQPSLNAKINKKNPREFFEACAKVISSGFGMPAIYNDEVGIKCLLQKGVTQEEANDWAVIGCVEPNLSGKLHQWSADATWNFGSAVEFVLTNGIQKWSGIDMGLHTGDFTKMETFDEFYEAVKDQVRNIIYLSSVMSNLNERAQLELCPCPLSSMLMEGCMESGKDIMAGGVKYNNGPGTLGVGMADICNSLAAIQKLVFEEKKIGKQELLDALDADFVGYERIQQMLINEAPKWGNDDQYVDHFAKELAHLTVVEHHKYKTMFGEFLMPSLYPVSSNVPCGEVVGALPSGRNAWVPLADGCSPNHGTELEGPTAVLKSVSNIDASEVDGGMLLNIKFSPSTIRGEGGIDRLVDYLYTFLDLDCYHVQFNVVDKETLLDAQAHPEDHNGLVVRVSGYSAYFNEVCTELQNDIIGRTEFSEFTA